MKIKELSPDTFYLIVNDFGTILQFYYYFKKKILELIIKLLLLFNIK